MAAFVFKEVELRRDLPEYVGYQVAERKMNLKDHR